MEPYVGQVLAGRYEVLKKLNQGGVGAVYLAMQRPLDRPVALKLLLRQHTHDPTAIKRFEKEASSIARLAHAHIITVYDFGATDDGNLFIAMEFLRGQSLREMLDAAGWIPWERSLHIVRGVTRALVAAHTQQIIHRDLKPDNVMLVESNGDPDFAKVLDFGLARSIQGGESEAQTNRQGMIAGSPAYLSPERVNGVDDDPRSDLYALGAVWFELLCGEPPFSGDTAVKVILQHMREPPRRPSTVRPENPIPSFIDELVLSLLEKQPTRRPESAAALLQKLDEIARPAGWQVSSTEDIGRRQAHDLDVAQFAAAAPAYDGESIRFYLSEAATPQASRTSSSTWRPTPTQNPFVTEAATGDESLFTQRHAPAAGPRSVATTTTKTRARATDTRGHRFLSLTAEEQDSHIAALHAAAATGIPARLDSVAATVTWLATAKTARSVGELCVAFLASRFDRVVVVDVRSTEPIALGWVGVGTLDDLSWAVGGHADLHTLSERRDAYYGPALATEGWRSWYATLGGSVPGAMFVGGLNSDGMTSFVVYADHRETSLRPGIKDVVVVLKEAAAALSLIG